MTIERGGTIGLDGECSMPVRRWLPAKVDCVAGVRERSCPHLVCRPRRGGPAMDGGKACAGMEGNAADRFAD